MRIRKFNENNISTFKVIFDGFETEEQAQSFVDWYEGSGEQDSAIWLEEHSDLSGAYVDLESVSKGKNEIVVPLRLFKK